MTSANPLNDFWAERGARFAPSEAGEVVAQFDDVDCEYHAARESAGLVDLSQRTKIELAGADRVRFLNNLCTNDVKALAPGQGCEAFLTTVQGKVAAHVYVFSANTTLLLDTVPGQSGRILAHLAKYLIVDDVQITDRTGDWFELFLSGPQAAQVLATAGTPADQIPHLALQHGQRTVAGVGCWLRRVALCGDPGFQILADREGAGGVAAALVEAGAVPIGMRAFDVLRIEAGTPLYGCDVTEQTLPQEVGRNAQCISFTKGCYLGQETVARIDAHGHVNRHLVGLRFESDTPPDPGSALLHEEKEVGRVASAALSPRLGVIALAYVRRGHEQPGRELAVVDRERRMLCRVAALPFV